MGERDIEMGPLHSDTTSARGTQHHFQEITEFRALLDSTAHTIQNLKEANQQLISVTASAAVKEIKGRMDQDIDEVQKMAHTMKAKLRKLIRNNVKNRKNPGCEQGTDMDISRMKLIISLKKKLKLRKSDLQNMGKTIQQENLEVIQRRISAVLSNVSGTDTGINLEVIRVNDAASIVQTVENKLQGTGREQIVAAVEEIKERGMDLNQKLLELQQVFEGMASSVDAQEKLDNAVSKEVNKVRENLDGELLDEMEWVDVPFVFVTLFLWLGLVGLLIFVVTSG